MRPTPTPLPGPCNQIIVETTNYPSITIGIRVGRIALYTIMMMYNTFRSCSAVITPSTS